MHPRALMLASLPAAFLAAFLAASVAVVVPSGAASAQDAGAKPAAVAPVSELKLKGPSGQQIAIKPADFAALPHITLKASIHDKTYSFEGVELTTLLAKVGTPTGSQIRGPAVADVVIISAADGYKAAFSLIETDPRFKAAKIILADKVDGAPLADRDGPFRLAVENDLDGARLVRSVNMIEVKQMGEDGPAAAPKAKVAAKPKAMAKVKAKSPS